MALEFTFLGQSGFLFDDGTHKVVIDPFLTDNPLAVHKPEDIECKTILLTHGRGQRPILLEAVRQGLWQAARRRLE